MNRIEQPLGRLERVDLRDCWPTEARDFTPWLAHEENIALLGETIGIELEVQESEAVAGVSSTNAKSMLGRARSR